MAEAPITRVGGHAESSDPSSTEAPFTRMDEYPNIAAAAGHLASAESEPQIGEGNATGSSSGQGLPDSKEIPPTPEAGASGTGKQPPPPDGPAGRAAPPPEGEDPESLRRQATIVASQPLQGPKQVTDSLLGAEIVKSFEPAGSVRVDMIAESADYMTFHFARPNAPTGEDARRGIGGIGMTARPLDQLERDLPGVRDEALAETGKIVFMGNGLSTAPIEVLRNSDVKGSTPPEVIIVDAVNYGELQGDLDRLGAEFDAKLVEQPLILKDALTRCDTLLGAEAAGRLKLVSHIVGDEEPPEIMKNADLAINVYGPPVSTIDDQLGCLKPGGKLYISSPHAYAVTKTPASFEPIRAFGQLVGFMVTKNEEAS